MTTPRSCGSINTKPALTVVTTNAATSTDKMIVRPFFIFCPRADCTAANTIEAIKPTYKRAESPANISAILILPPFLIYFYSFIKKKKKMHFLFLNTPNKTFYNEIKRLKES